jgi:UDP-N-acetylglucosamine--N-acetylmuramyl-(pentapeptide) pyrophosphoryl-undecaprenol N-acetylglucosamine transferase
MIARWAALHAVALPEDIYPYPQDKTVTTGIPLSKDFKPVTDALKKRYRKDIGVPEDAKLLFVIGGGLGSQRVNQAVTEVMPHLLRDFDDLQVVHAAGSAHEDRVRQAYVSALPIEEQGRVKVVGFIPDVYLYSGAADIVVSRAGATNLAEFAVQGKACIVIPSGFLAGGHQLANARYLEKQGAAVVIDEDDLADDPNRLAKQAARLLKDSRRLGSLGRKLAGFAQPRAAETIAKLILEKAGEVKT